MLHFESFLSGMLTFYAVEFISLALTDLYFRLNNYKTYGLSRYDYKRFIEWMKKDLGISYKMFMKFNFLDRLMILDRFNYEVLSYEIRADK